MRLIDGIFKGFEKISYENNFIIFRLIEHIIVIILMFFGVYNNQNCEFSFYALNLFTFLAGFSTFLVVNKYVQIKFFDNKKHIKSYKTLYLNTKDYYLNTNITLYIIYAIYLATMGYLLLGIFLITFAIFEKELLNIQYSDYHEKI